METFTNCRDCDINLDEDQVYPMGEDYICLMCLEDNQRDDTERKRYYA